MPEGVLLKKSMGFAVRVVRLYQYLCSHKREFVLSKQLLRSGTSVGANVREANYAQSRREFIAKMQIALKEAGETAYWLELLCETEYLSQAEYESTAADCTELIKLLTAIIKTTKNHQTQRLNVNHDLFTIPYSLFTRC